MKIVLTGGGSGGHLVPLVAVARKIKQVNPEAEFLFLGPNGKLEERFMGEIAVTIKNISVGKLRRYFSFLNFVDFFKVIFGFFQSLFWLLVYMPDVVFSKGGFVSFPVVMAAWIYRIPILIHESDSRPGLANSILGKFANRVAVSYPDAEKEFPATQVVLTGNPLREGIDKGSAEKARELFSLSENKKTIFVYGGSQGAKMINDKMVDLLPELLREYQVIHQTGEKNFEDVRKRAADLGIKIGRDNYFPVAFVGDELPDILAVSDLVVSRAGANSISEIAANGKPAIIIPLSNSAGNHQRMNAFSLEKTNSCLVLEENNLGENLLLGRIKEIMSNDQLRTEMSQNIRKFYNPDAAEKIAKGVLELIK